MVKFVLSFIFTFSFIYADLLDEKVKNLVDKESYLIHQKLIDIIFKNKSKFYKSTGEIDVVKVAKYLKDSGLLKLFFEAPATLNITFNTNQNPIFFMKLITNSLNAMGYYFFITKEAKREGNVFSWSISLTTEYAIDPTIFARELGKRNCKILDIIKNSKDSWEYIIDISKAKVLEAKEVRVDEFIELGKSINDYWLKVENGEILKIVSRKNNSWYPYVAFYDKNLNLVSIYKEDSKVIKSINIKVPENCLYIKISDIFTLNNIKNGFSVYLKGDMDVSRN